MLENGYGFIESGSPVDFACRKYRPHSLNYRMLCTCHMG